MCDACDEMHGTAFLHSAVQHQLEMSMYICVCFDVDGLLLSHSLSAQMLICVFEFFEHFDEIALMVDDVCCIRKCAKRKDS